MNIWPPNHWITATPKLPCNPPRSTTGPVATQYSAQRRCATSDSTVKNRSFAVLVAVYNLTLSTCIQVHLFSATTVLGEH
ncbi:hypothetical protein BD410DRAFT_788197 [Rickenella mellea]|uniref:Uncharacterized protein n=1 Tax=Rickenella mellea TaxID=50990 RepID=A0A4Y7Q7G1_9AGAM|nr:hypothetical protein BD410DRAFT_788197 [Rickenella mellea]